MTAVLILALLLAAAVASLRWLRVAQREHYEPGSVGLFAQRWFTQTSPVNPALLVVAALLAIGSLRAQWALFGAAALIAVLPVGLGLRGRSSPLRWTARLRTLAGVLTALLAVVAVAAAFTSVFVLGVAVFVLPALTDLALWLCLPLEKRKARGFLSRAQTRLAQTAPQVVAITGSYGKTSTKEYVQHLLTGTVASVASPASFNNLAGLSRTINAHLAPGTDVLVAEVGTYGAGGLRALGAWGRARRRCTGATTLRASAAGTPGSRIRTISTSRSAGG